MSHLGIRKNHLHQTETKPEQPDAAAGYLFDTGHAVKFQTPYLISTTLTAWTPWILLYSDCSCGGDGKTSSQPRIRHTVKPFKYKMRSQTIKQAKSHFSWPRPYKAPLNARWACANGTYRVHHRFRDLDEGGWVDVLQLGAVDQGVGEVDESSVID